jgi:hypothetical protein
LPLKIPTDLPQKIINTYVDKNMVHFETICSDTEAHMGVNFQRILTEICGMFYVLKPFFDGVKSDLM